MSTRKSSARTARGRPRSRAVDRALIAAACAEFKRKGYRAMSMEAIAQRAGVSKVSLYRRWPAKSAVIADVLRCLNRAKPVADHGSLAADLCALLRQSFAPATVRTAAKVVMRTMGEISDDPELRSLYREHLLAPRLVQLRSLLERARARGELRSDLPVDLAAAAVAGPIFACYLAMLTDADVHLPSDLAEQLTRTMLKGMAGELQPDRFEGQSRKAEAAP